MFEWLGVTKRVLVVGPGALGVLIAVRLAHAGHQVFAAARDAKAAKQLPASWTAVDDTGNLTTAEVPALGSPKGISGVDVLVLATKCDDAADALRKWLPCVHPQGAVVAIQNGIIGDDLAQIAGDRLVECTVSLPATLLGPGQSEQTGPGGFILGPWPDRRMEPATPLEQAAVLRDAGPLRVHMNMQGVKWTKLLINSAVTGLGALTGRTLGELMDDPRARRAFLHIINEGHRAGIQEGVRFETVLGFHPRMLVSKGKPGRLGMARREAMLRYMGRKHRRQRSSSLQSLERGRRTEAHHLNGRIANTASAPVNATIAAMVARIEAGESEPSMDHLDTLPLQFH